MWTKVLCVLAAGSIARLMGNRMSISSNLQVFEFVRVGPSLLKRPPVQGLEHLFHTCIWGVFNKSPAGRSTLNQFKPGNITFGVGAPD